MKRKEERQAILLRTTPEMHRELAEDARAKGLSLNALLNQRLEEKLRYLAIPIIRMNNKEFELVVKEATERIKNFIYMNAKQRVKEELVRRRKKIRPVDKITFTYYFSLNGSDIVQFLGGLRRKNK
jgi:hypothetical protein